MRRSRPTTTIVLSCVLIPVLLVCARFERASRKAELNRELIAAIKADDAREVAGFLALGADANCRDLSIDTRSEWRRIWEMLLAGKRGGAVRNPALLIAVSGSIGSQRVYPPAKPAIVKLLLEHGANPNRRNFSLWSPLIEATAFDGEQTINLLLQYGADPNYQGSPQQFTALMYAVQTGQEQKVRALLRAGADPNIRVDGRTPLQRASGSSGAKERRIAQMLRRAGGV